MPTLFNRTFLSIVLVSACLMSACAQKEPEKKSKRSNGPAEIHLTDAQVESLDVETGKVSNAMLTDTVECNGEIETAEPLKVQIFSPAPGRVTQLPVNLGESVTQGQLLAIIRSDEIGQIQSEMLQKLLENDAQLRQADAQLELSKSTFKRETELLKEEVSARADFEAAQAQYKKDLATRDSIRISNAANIQSFRERLSLFGVGQGTIDLVLRTRKLHPYLTITAPRSGIVTERNANPGEMVETSKTILSVSDLREVWLVGDVYEKDIEKVKIGQPITATVDSLPGRTFTGKVNFVSNLLDARSRTLSIQGDMPNTDLILKPNMFARMSINTGKHNAIAVPQSAVESIGDTQMVYVETAPRTFQERHVQIGQPHGEFMEIKKGLREGETIALKGTVGIKGMAMKEMGDAQGNTKE